MAQPSLFGGTGESSACGHGNAVGLSSIDDSFSSLLIIAALRRRILYSSDSESDSESGPSSLWTVSMCQPF